MKICSKIVIFLKKLRKNLLIVISCLALVLSGINFHWTFLKNRKVLHLIYVDKITPGMEPQFAIVNGGKSDILITNLSCSFQYYDNTKACFTPSQIIEWKESDSSLLSSGKAFHCKVQFKEKFTKSFVEKGRLENVDKRQLRMHDMYVDISWVEMDGRCYNKSVKLMKYGFNDECEIMQRGPISFRKPINLYKVKSSQRDSAYPIM
jgi:hypothetical protein